MRQSDEFRLFPRRRSLLVLALALAVSALICGCSSPRIGFFDFGSESDSPDVTREMEPEEPADPPIDSADLIPSTDVLEYSDKPVDPLSLVACSLPEAKISTTSEIDLGVVGDVTVDYKIELSGASKIVPVVFTVRDTRKPVIELANNSLEITLGDTVDLQENIVSVSDPVDGHLPYVDAEPTRNAGEPGMAKVYETGWYCFADIPKGISAAGTYPIRVVASDVNGNREEKVFDLVVKEPEPVPEPEPAAAPAPVAPPQSDRSLDSDVRTYVVNTNTGKFHEPGCSSVDRMASHNRKDVEATRDELIAQGYEPCKRCNP